MINDTKQSQKQQGYISTSNEHSNDKVAHKNEDQRIVHDGQAAARWTALRVLLLFLADGVGAGKAGKLVHPITLAPPISPVARFGPGPAIASPTFAGAPVIVGAAEPVGVPSDADEREARRDDAAAAGMVVVARAVVPPSDAVLANDAVLIAVAVAAGGVTESGGGDEEVSLPLLLLHASAATNAGFPPIGAEEISSANKSL